ncbi:hypothetical protein JCM17845_27280 [Iodidimonas gelatinilytica]|uniref:Uncharacterized protein n=1 Tax=Iodidimonas gelatinilytica TaxID=1236966 RepID=A0A5A7N340_9PROT|nr:hypothetical protein [Iodidimonas gelatinilytica]GER02105.1 hypothetical protein JCM17845_27280 [Iodidimonas gelatinilytica]
MHERPQNQISANDNILRDDRGHMLASSYPVQGSPVYDAAVSLVKLLAHEEARKWLKHHQAVNENKMPKRQQQGN